MGLYPRLPYGPLLDKFFVIDFGAQYRGDNTPNNVRLGGAPPFLGAGNNWLVNEELVEIQKRAYRGMGDRGGNIANRMIGPRRQTTNMGKTGRLTGDGDATKGREAG